MKKILLVMLCAVMVFGTSTAFASGWVIDNPISEEVIVEAPNEEVEEPNLQRLKDNAEYHVSRFEENPTDETLATKAQAAINALPEDERVPYQERYDAIVEEIAEEDELVIDNPINETIGGEEEVKDEEEEIVKEDELVIERPVSETIDGEEEDKEDKLVIESLEGFSIIPEAVEEIARKTFYTFQIGNEFYTYKNVDGNVTRYLMDVKPYILNDRTMLPMRYTAYTLGLQVAYDDTTRIATFFDRDTIVTINIDSNEVKLNGSVVKLDTPIQNIDGRLMTPVSQIARLFGRTNGDWNDGIVQDIEWVDQYRLVFVFE